MLVKYNGQGGDVVIPNGVTSIGEGAFTRCTRLTSVTIPASVVEIRDGNEYAVSGGAFASCKNLASVTMTHGLTRIGCHAFESCTSLTSVTIPDSVTSIGQCAFEQCSALTSVTIPASVTSIEEYAFGYCTGLTSVTIPENVAAVGSQAFCYCTSLADVTILARSIDIDNYAFTRVDATFHIIAGSNAIKWAEANDYAYDTFKEELSEESLTLNVGKTHTLTVSILGKALNGVSWTSSDQKVATVKNGKVTAVKAGKCTITAKIKNGKRLTCKVTVKDPAKLSKTSLTLKVGKTATLTVSKLAGRKVTWTSSDKKIATVKNGKVTAVKAGTCTITAKIKNGKTLTCKVTVKDK